MERSQTNKDLRKFYINLRDKISSDIRIVKSSKIVDNLLALLESDFKGADIFLCFYPFASEVDLRSLYSVLLRNDKRLYFPVSNSKNHKLNFLQISDLSADFHIGSYNIMEPNENLKELNFGNQNIIAITPGVVFDKNMNRIGYGGGFYDRFFAEHPDIIRVGVCFEEQLVNGIRPQSHDIAMNYIVTDNEVWKG